VDDVLVAPSMDFFNAQVDELVGFTMDKGRLKFLSDETNSISNRVPPNYYVDEPVLRRDFWLVQYDRETMQSLCKPTPMQ
jgi:hypothetical protein